MADGLSGRVAQRAEVARTGGGGGEVERAPRTLAQQVEDMQKEFQRAMPSGTEARQLVRDALSLMRTTPHLAECDSTTVLGGLMTFAQLGLRPGVLGHGWLLPFKKRAPVLDSQGRKVLDSRGKEQWRDVYQAQIVIGYKGYVELIHQSPSVKDMIGRAIHANDEFDIELGLHDNLSHKPPKTGPRGPVVGYYAIVKYHAGGYTFWHMTRDESIEWRNAFAMSSKTDRQTGAITGSGPWFDMTGPDGATGFDQMAIKTCFLRAARWAPKATDPTLARATTVDGAVRFTHDALEPDQMLEAEEAVRGDVIDAELVDNDQGPAATAETPTVPATPAGSDRDVTDGQHKAIAAIMRAGKVTKDAERLMVLAHILERPVASQKELRFADASFVIDTLNTWQAGGNLDADLAAIVGAGAPAPAAAATTAATAPAVDLPKPGTKAWHEDGHPVRSGDKVTRVPALINGECGICEEAANADGAKA